MATSLSSITDLSNYSLNGTSLGSIIDGNDIKIEISLGSSTNDNSKPYSSYKLDLNTLLSVIKSYVDSRISSLSTSLSNSVDAISTSLSNEANSKFVQISGETRQISSNTLSIKTTQGLTIQSGNNIQLSSNNEILLCTGSNKYVKVQNTHSDINNKISCVATAALWN